MLLFLTEFSHLEQVIKILMGSYSFPVPSNQLYDRRLLIFEVFIPPKLTLNTAKLENQQQLTLNIPVTETLVLLLKYR